MQTKHRQLYTSLSLFIGSLLVFTWGLRGQEVTGFDSRFYLFALEMWRNGVDWFPTTYQHLYPDYLVTSTGCIYIVAKLFGALNKLTAVLPSALFAAGTVVVTYLIAARWDKRWGLYAVCFLLMTVGFLKSARSISLDMYPTFVTALVFYLLCSSVQYPRRIVWIYPLLLLSFLFRGPIGLVIPAGVMCTYFVLRGDLKRFYVNGLLASLLLLVCCGSLMALAYYVGGNDFLQAVLHMQIGGRLDNPFLPHYFYFTDSIGNYAFSYPLAWFTLAGASYYWWRKQPVKHGRVLLQLAGWMLIVMIGMSIPDDKKIRYILPMLPAAALLAAYPFAFYLRCRTWMLFAGALIFVSIYIGVAERLTLDFEKGRYFVATTEVARAAANAQLGFYREDPDGLPIKYLINTPYAVQPVFIKNANALLNNSTPTFFITSEEYFMAIPLAIVKQLRVLKTDRLGHVRVVVFTQR